MREHEIKYVVEYRYGSKWEPGLCKFPTEQAAAKFIATSKSGTQRRIVQVETIRTVVL